MNGKGPEFPYFPMVNSGFHKTDFSPVLDRSKLAAFLIVNEKNGFLL